MGELAVRIITGLGLAIGAFVLLLLFVEFGIDWVRAVFRRGRRGRLTRRLRRPMAMLMPGGIGRSRISTRLGSRCGRLWRPISAGRTVPSLGSTFKFTS